MAIAQEQERLRQEELVRQQQAQEALLKEQRLEEERKKQKQEEEEAEEKARQQKEKEAQLKREQVRNELWSGLSGLESTNWNAVHVFCFYLARARGEEGGSRATWIEEETRGRGEGKKRWIASTTGCGHRVINGRFHGGLALGEVRISRQGGANVRR